MVWYVFKELLKKRSLQRAGVCRVSSVQRVVIQECMFWVTTTAVHFSVLQLCLTVRRYTGDALQCYVGFAVWHMPLFLQYLELIGVWLWFYVNSSFWASPKNKRVSSMFSFQPRGSQNQMSTLNSAHCFFVSVRRVFTAALRVASFHFLMGKLVKSCFIKTIWQRWLFLLALRALRKVHREVISLTTRFKTLRQVCQEASDSPSSLCWHRPTGGRRNPQAAVLFAGESACSWKLGLVLMDGRKSLRLCFLGCSEQSGTKQTTNTGCGNVNGRFASDYNPYHLSTTGRCFERKRGNVTEFIFRCLNPTTRSVSAQQLCL